MKNIYLIIFLLMSCPLYAMNVAIPDLVQPDDPNVSVPEIIYHSPFQDYQSQGQIKLQSWDKANEAVTTQPMSHMQHMNMPMEKNASDKEQGSMHSNHQMKGDE
ncbi:MAG: hypothetical protein U1E78_11625 [Gammaproteobacteria bacterium]